MWCSYVFFFFFQAEDGIRDKLVTGVQTCALPILTGRLGELTRPVLLLWGDADPISPVSVGRDRKSVVWGKSVDLGGRRIIKKKNHLRRRARARLGARLRRAGRDHRSALAPPVR